MNSADSPTGSIKDTSRHDKAQREGDISVLQVVNALLRHWVIIVVSPLVVAAVAVVMGFSEDRTYTSTASFMPESQGEQAGRLAGLASRFGVEVPTAGGGASPQFYADLLTSRRLLKQVVLTEYEMLPREGRGSTEKMRSGGAEPRRGNLVDFFGTGDTSSGKRRVAVVRAIGTLRRSLEVSTDTDTRVVELSVTTHQPRLSRQIADRVVELVNQFNVERRQSRASAKRDFTAKQVARAESALYTAEDSLRRFLQRNRSYQNSPELRFRYERLQRRVNLRQQVFASLSQSLEQAKIDEVRSTPVVTVVDPPELPVHADSRRLILRGVLGLLLGGILGILWASGRELISRGQEMDPEEYAEFKRLSHSIVDDIKTIWRRLRRSVT